MGRKGRQSGLNLVSDVQRRGKNRNPKKQLISKRGELFVGRTSDGPPELATKKGAGENTLHSIAREKSPCQTTKPMEIGQGDWLLDKKKGKTGGKEGGNKQETVHRKRYRDR